MCELQICAELETMRNSIATAVPRLQRVQFRVCRVLLVWRVRVGTYACVRVYLVCVVHVCSGIYIRGACVCCRAYTCVCVYVYMRGACV